MYDEQADEQADKQADNQADEHIKTKLNALYNYIYNNGSGEEIGISEKEKDGLICQLKKLELYAANTKAYNIMPAERFLDEKIMMWSLKEIYLSPYRVYLQNLKREEFVHKYLKTKKYITEKADFRLEELIKYFIICMREELESQKNSSHLKLLKEGDWINE